MSSHFADRQQTLCVQTMNEDISVRLFKVEAALMYEMMIVKTMNSVKRRLRIEATTFVTKKRFLCIRSRLKD